MSKIILTDVDQVLLEFNKPFERYIKSLDIDMLNISHQNVLDFVHSDRVADLKPIPNAVEVVRQLKSRGYRLLALSSISSYPEVKKMRVKNLKRYFGADIFEDCWCIETGADKLEPLQDLRCVFGSKIVCWVEDNGVNALHGAKMGIRTFLRNTEHFLDVKHPNILRYDDWNQIRNWLYINDQV